MMTQPPLSLYIHIPWCIKKCPYCDFNSHQQPAVLPASAYIQALIDELDQHLSPSLQKRPLHSIFIGGGTPSLLEAAHYERLFAAIRERFDCIDGMETTLEANPGTRDQTRFKGYRQAGINRLSIGVQSLHNTQLKALGRVHDAQTAIAAVKDAQDAGFERINLDLMFALPKQTPEEAIQDLQRAIALSPSHLSWYHLTIEPNTLFFHSPPPRPDEAQVEDMQTQGEALLHAAGFEQYEVSAYAKNKNYCQHNLNYWSFGDYLGIGAGAHSKISLQDTQTIQRHWNVKNPRDYLNPSKAFVANRKVLPDADKPLEFMMNACRLKQAIPISLFEARTGLAAKKIEPPILEAIQLGLLTTSQTHWTVTARGHRYLNELLGLFLN